MRSLHCLWIFLLAAQSVPAQTPALSRLPAEQIVARVNGVELRGAALNDYVEALLPSIEQHGRVQPERINTYRQQALERMILHELIYQEAARRRIRIADSEVELEIEAARRRLRSPDALEQLVARRGLTLDAWRAQIRRNLMVAAMVQREVIAPSRVTADEVRQYYRRNLARFREPEAVQVRHILIPAASGAEAEARQIRLKTLINNSGESFDQLARAHSRDDYRVMGGLLGWVHRGRLEPELEKAAFALHPGETSEVIQTASGFHLLRVEDRRRQRLVPFAVVRDKIRAELEAKKAGLLRQRFRARLQQKARIEVLGQF